MRGIESSQASGGRWRGRSRSRTALLSTFAWCGRPSRKSLLHQCCCTLQDQIDDRHARPLQTCRLVSIFENQPAVPAPVLRKYPIPQPTSLALKTAQIQQGLPGSQDQHQHQHQHQHQLMERYVHATLRIGACNPWRGALGALEKKTDLLAEQCCQNVRISERRCMCCSDPCTLWANCKRSSRCGQISSVPAYSWWAARQSLAHATSPSSGHDVHNSTTGGALQSSPSLLGSAWLLLICAVSLEGRCTFS